METKVSVTSFTVLLFFFAAVLVGAVGAGPAVDGIAGAVVGPDDETARTITARSLEPISAAAGLEVLTTAVVQQAVSDPNHGVCIVSCAGKKPGDPYLPGSHCNRRYYSIC